MQRPSRDEEAALLVGFLRELVQTRRAEAERLAELASAVERDADLPPAQLPVARLEALAELPARPPGWEGVLAVPLARLLAGLLAMSPVKRLSRVGDRWRLASRLRALFERVPIRHAVAQPQRWGNFVAWRSKYGARKHDLRLPPGQTGRRVWQELGLGRAFDAAVRPRLGVLGRSHAPDVLWTAFDRVDVSGVELERQLDEGSVEVLLLEPTAIGAAAAAPSEPTWQGILTACEAAGALPVVWIDAKLGRDLLELGTLAQFTFPASVVVLTDSLEGKRTLEGAGIAAQVVTGLSLAAKAAVPEPTVASSLALLSPAALQQQRLEAALQTDALKRLAVHAGLPNIGTRARLASVICVSHRPDRVEACIEAFRRQTYPHKEFVFVANTDRLSDAWIDRFYSLGPDLVLLRTDAAHSLGESLNRARAVARGELWTKLDDDDHYGAAYLADQVAALRQSGAALVGKGTYFTYLEGEDALYLAPHAAENSFSERFIHGGTILADRRAVEEIDFLPVRRGTDSLFLQQCKLLGHRIYSSDRFNFAYMRYKAEGHHTYDVNDRELRRTYVFVRKGLDLATIDV